MGCSPCWSAAGRSATPGCRPTPKARSSVVTVTFAKAGNDTLMMLVHTGLPDNDNGQAHRKGWTFFMDSFPSSLRRRLIAGPAIGDALNRRRARRQTICARRVINDQPSYRWIIVAAGGVIGCVAIGCLFSLPVFIIPIAEETGWSRTGISAAMTIAFLAMAVGSMVWGMLSDRYGPRVVVLAGAVILSVSLYGLSFVTSLAAYQAIYGVLIGGSMAAFFAPMMATVTGWFDTHRSLAVSLVSAGMGMAPVTMSPLAAWLIAHHDWRTSYQIIAVIVGAGPRAAVAAAAPAAGARGRCGRPPRAICPASRP